MAAHSNAPEGRTPGQLGRYQQVATLGQGGMGTVYLALASGFGQFRKLLVIKELRQDLTRQKGFVRLFMDEAKLAARLSHPNVVQTFEAFQDGNRYLLAMEYLDGQSLSALIVRAAGQSTAKLPLPMHIHILCEVLSGLHYAHELRDFDGTGLHVVHRDVSPQNVFLTYHGEVKVVDFGVAKAANAATSTAPGLFVGKFSYAAPEQILGRAVDARTDVFAVGVMLWQAIADRRFSSASPTPDAFRARAEGTEQRIRDVVPEVDPELALICDRAMALDPEDRYPTAQAFRAALHGYLETRQVRIHDADLGHLMQQFFAADRQALHAQIEAAVQASGTQTNVESLPFLTGDKEATAVGGLSMSAAPRDSYSSTKVTRLPAQNVMPPRAAAPRWRTPVLLSGALAAALGVAGWALLSREEPAVHTKLLAPTLITAARVLAPAPQPVFQPPTPPRVEPTPPRAAERPAAPRRARAQRTAAAAATRAAAEAAPDATKPRFEAGSDLSTARRSAPARIDVENPYQ
jgi:eukaryotic-like serine/threonine-protein kinase